MAARPPARAVRARAFARIEDTLSVLDEGTALTLLFGGCFRLHARAERRRGRGLAIQQPFPAELLSLAPALLGELQTLGGDGQHVGLAVHVDLALQGLLELGSHVIPQLIIGLRPGCPVRVPASRMRSRGPAVW